MAKQRRGFIELDELDFESNQLQPVTRHLRIGFREAIPVGSVVVRGGGMLSVLKPDAAYPGEALAKWLSVTET